jgi:hypothetical protein
LYQRRDQQDREAKADRLDSVSGSNDAGIYESMGVLVMVTALMIVVVQMTCGLVGAGVLCAH